MRPTASSRGPRCVSDRIEGPIDPFHDHGSRAAADATAVKDASRCAADSAAQDGIDWVSPDDTRSAGQGGIGFD